MMRVATYSDPASRQRWRPILAWFAVVVGSSAAIVTLQSLGGSPQFTVEWGDLWGWLGSVPAERVLLGLGRAVATVLAWWVLLSTLLCTAARASRIPALVRSVEWATLPAVRRVAERAVAMSLVVTGLGATGPVALAGVDPMPGETDSGTGPTVLVLDPAADEPTPRPVYVPVPAGPGDDLPLPYTPTPAGVDSPTTPVTMVPPPYAATPGNDPAPVVPPEDTSPPSPDGAVPGPSAQAPAEHTVQPGESLWTIAESRLAGTFGRSPSDAETSPYWALVVAANRDTIRSGNPDLIYPGEIITCPPIPEPSP